MVVCTYVHIYIYIYREREREKGSLGRSEIIKLVLKYNTLELGKAPFWKKINIC